MIISLLPASSCRARLRIATAATATAVAAFALRLPSVEPIARPDLRSRFLVHHPLAVPCSVAASVVD